MKKISRNTLIRALLNAGLSKVAVYSGAAMDGEFCVPTKKWLSEFSSSLAFQIETNFGSFLPETNDCDDYSLFCMSFARLWHRKSQTTGTLPIGAMAYTSTRKGERHMALFAYADNELVFLEPQSGEFINLTPYEIKSCDFTLF